MNTKKHVASFLLVVLFSGVVANAALPRVTSKKSDNFFQEHKTVLLTTAAAATQPTAP